MAKLTVASYSVVAGGTSPSSIKEFAICRNNSVNMEKVKTLNFSRKRKLGTNVS